MNAHLFLDPGTHHIVGFSQGPVVIHPYFGNEKKRDPFGTTRSALDPGQHGMNDIFHQIVLSRRDKDLVPGDGVGSVIVLYCGGLQRPHIRSGLGFREKHGAPPLAGEHLFQKQLFEFLGAKSLHQFSGTVGQSRIHHEGVVGSVQVLGCGQTHGFGHPLPSPLRVLVHGQPLPLFELLPRPVETFRHRHPSVVKGATLRITLFLRRQNLFDRQFPDFGNDHVHCFFVELCEIFMLAQTSNFKLLVEHKIDIPPICDYLCHGLYSPY